MEFSSKSNPITIINIQIIETYCDALHHSYISLNYFPLFLHGVTLTPHPSNLPNTRKSQQTFILHKTTSSSIASPSTPHLYRLSCWLFSPSSIVTLLLNNGEVRLFWLLQ